MNAQFERPSGRQHRIQMQANLIYCLWTCGKAWAGSDAPPGRFTVTLEEESG
jgi:hypothetical protein